MFTRERDREADRPAVQVALDERAAAERALPGADAEGARQPGVLPRVHEHQEDQDDRDDDLDDGEDRAPSRRQPSGLLVGRPSSSSSRRISTASARSCAVERAPVGLGRACRCGSRARRRGSRGTSPRARPRGRARSRAPRRSVAAAPRAQRRADEQHDDGDQHARRRSARRGRPRPGVGADATRGRARARRARRSRPRTRRRAGSPAGHSAIRPPANDDQAADPDPGHQRRDDERNVAGGGLRAVALRRARERLAERLRAASPACSLPSIAANDLVALVDDRLQRRDVRRHRGPQVARAGRPAGRPRSSPRPRRSARPGRGARRCDGK